MSHRTRTFSWDDPLEMAAAISELSGLERMRQVICGELPTPPIAQLMNIRLVEADEGRVVFEGVPEEYHYNPIGMVARGIRGHHPRLGDGMRRAHAAPRRRRLHDAGVQAELRQAAQGQHRPGAAIGTVLHGGRTTSLAEGRLVAHRRNAPRACHYHVSIFR